jgi:aryl-alcohol dehydrogenase-like predicted oxidoreductase
MKYTILGKTGMEVSPICIGAWQLGGPLFFDGKPDGHPDPGKENVLRMIRELGDLGINHIDTAEQYSNGESERRVGEALEGERDKWIISTKFGYRVGPGNVRIDDSSPSTIMPSIEGSLKRLRSDYIDIMLYHCAPDLNDLQTGKELLEQAKKEGKIRHYGISTNDVGLVREMLQTDMIDVLQFASSMLNESTELSEICRDNNIGTQVRGVMAQGRLSGKYFSKTPEWSSDDNRSKNFKEHDFSKYAVLQECLPDSYTMSQAAIRWILDTPHHHTICMGAKSIEDYRSAIAALDFPPLSKECREKFTDMIKQKRCG